MGLPLDLETFRVRRGTRLPLNPLGPSRPAPWHGIPWVLSTGFLPLKAYPLTTWDPVDLPLDTIEWDPVDLPT